MSQHIVLVDDDVDLTRMMGRFLERNNFSISILRSGEGACERILRINPDLVILDLMLPGMSGMEICRRLRPLYNGPILMLTALSDDIDHIAGLNQGADDYLPKPVKPELLLARVLAQLRRGTRVNPKSSSDANVSCAGLEIIPAKHRATWQEAPLDLSAKEFDLLYFLACHCGEVLSRDRLYLALYQTNFDGSDRSLDLLVSRLRKKLPHGNKMIRTLRGQGYILTLGLP